MTRKKQERRECSHWSAQTDLRCDRLGLIANLTIGTIGKMGEEGRTHIAQEGQWLSCYKHKQ